MSLSFEQKENELEEKRNSLREQISKLQHQLEITESNLDLLMEMRPKKQTVDEILTKKLLESPAISVSEAFIEGMRALQQFTKDALVTWVRNRYPSLEFSEKSLGRPLRDMILRGEVELIKPNQGSKTQAVYGFKSI